MPHSAKAGAGRTPDFPALALLPALTVSAGHNPRPAELGPHPGGVEDRFRRAAHLDAGGADEAIVKLVDIGLCSAQGSWVLGMWMVRPWNLLCSPNRAVTWMDRGSPATERGSGMTLKRLDAPLRKRLTE